MTEDDPPANAAGRVEPLLRGTVVFLVMGAIGQILATAAWLAIGRGVSLGTFARIGAIYVGLFHHVAVRLTVAGPEVASSSGRISVSFGVALLSVTLVGVMLLFRAGRRVAARGGGGPVVRVLRGAAIAPSYAVLTFALALVSQVGTPLRPSGFATGALRVSLSPWQAFAFPLAVAAVAGGVGGMASALDGGIADHERLRGLRAASGGAWRMLVLGLALSGAGLVLAGTLQPEGPVALLTPTTARYFHAVFDRPADGLVFLGHHLAVLPDEATWTLVPAMGACDQVGGIANADLLCLTRFPTSVSIPVPSGESAWFPVPDVTLGPAPPGYLSFLLVPAIATVLGGRRAGQLAGTTRRQRVLAGALGGALFAILVGVAALLSTITVGYASAGGGEASSGSMVVGPDVVSGTLLGVAWGVAGGVLGAATVGRSLRSAPPSRRTGPPPPG